MTAIRPTPDPDLGHLELAGVLPVVSTPFDELERVDSRVLCREIEWLLDCGVHGLAIAMVSEVLRLGDRERIGLTDSVLAAVDGRVPVVVSVGAESTVMATSFAEHAVTSGAAALMAIPPVAIALPDRAVLDYYRAILNSVSVPVVVQDASGYLGRPLGLDLYVSLLEEFGSRRVLFKPEAQPLGPRLTALLDASGGQARVFEGTGGIGLVDAHRRGVVGTMPGPEVPWALVALWAALTAGDREVVDAINGPLSALVAVQSTLDSFVAVEKHLLVAQGVFASVRRRRPYADDVDPTTLAEADRLTALLRHACPRAPIPVGAP